jgi:PhzF family phenazine biosynthesis protein
MSRRFIQCDVFTSVPTKGNALAVVVDGDDLTPEQMQSFARWTNLAETTFLMKPKSKEADYKVRIFTPVREMLFAGHPTLGSCIAWLETGGVPKNPEIVKQECGVGIVDVDLTGEFPAFAAPATEIKPMRDDEKARIMYRLSIRAEQVLATTEMNNGPIWQVLELDSSESVLAVDSSRVKWPEFKAIGLIGRKKKGSDSDFEVRMLAPSSGMSEDPITGSLNAAIACWFRKSGRLTRTLIVSQGTKIDRLGRVTIISKEDGSILVGGGVHILVKGEVYI